MIVSPELGFKAIHKELIKRLPDETPPFNRVRKFAQKVRQEITSNGDTPVDKSRDGATGASQPLRRKTLRLEAMP
jgi:hypothetical protein